MDSNDQEKSVMMSVLAGIGIGVLVGAVAGLLLAPKPGAETRDDISHTLGDLGNKISDLSQQVASRVKTVVESGKQAVQEKIEKAADDAGEASA